MRGVPGSVTYSVVVMAYNEVGSLPGVVRDLDATLAGFGRPYELIIVDDGSSDGTGAAADRLAAELDRVRVIHHSPNLGLGEVYRRGFDAASGRFVSFFPADGQFPASILETLVPLAEEHDLVLGYITRRPGSWTSRALSSIERLLYRALFGDFPRFQGIFLLRTSLLDELPLKTRGRGWGIVMELVLRAVRGGFRVTSVPTDFRARAEGGSKVKNLRTICSNLGQLVRLRREL